MCIRATLEYGGITDMSLLTFDPARALLRRLATADPAELPALRRDAARLLGIAVVPEPEPCPELTRREREALGLLGYRVPRSTVSVSVDLVIGDSWAYDLLKRLERRGYVRRVGPHVGGGWVRVATVALAEAA